ncbi:hypothetical protein RRG08_008078 [Elysia crispata]|uniref:Uncharacterized protein n=1 Tax=Elysia crispata TaxID=231223 RepID=A0AAE0Y076_9GAST|nr:hypothetical protein RRG08_008078 [Elysia crispata]
MSTGDKSQRVAPPTVLDFFVIFFKCRLQSSEEPSTALPNILIICCPATSFVIFLFRTPSNKSELRNRSTTSRDNF